LAGRRARGAAVGARAAGPAAVRPRVRPRPLARRAARRRDAPPGGGDRAGAPDGPTLALARTHERTAAGRCAAAPRALAVVRPADRRDRHARSRTGPVAAAVARRLPCL